MKKILIGYIIDFKHSGIDKYLFNVLKIAHQNNIKVDFLCNKREQETVEMLKPYDCEVIKISSLKNPLKHYADVKRALKNGGYDAAYFNISEPLNMMGAKAAHDLKVPCFVHSHSSDMDCQNKFKRFIRGAINKICKCFLYRYADKYFACSKKAGEWLFPKKQVASDKFTVIFNAVDTDKFFNDRQLGLRKRAELNISPDTAVIGHIGNYCYQKNNFFLVDIMKEVLKIKQDALMLCIGIGPDLEAVKQYAVDNKVDSNMHFLGLCGEVPETLRAIDVFVLPSRFEGLPISGVEAQMCGIPAIFSNTISEEVILTDKSIMLPINDARNWAQKILELSQEVNVQIFDSAIQNFSLNNQKKQIVDNIFTR